MRVAACYGMPGPVTTPETCRSLYVHVPFCASLCDFCDFYSVVLEPALVAPLVDAVLRELAAYASIRALDPDTFYIGGGTPTVLPPAELKRLLTGVRAYASTAAEPEFTVEANPATVTTEVAGVLAACGVNRVSVGAQSFQPDELRTLGRRHQPEDVPATVATLRRHGLARINLDLIFGIPRQSLESWQRSLHTALQLAPDHLSCYGLTCDADTPLRRRLEYGDLEPVSEDLEADMYELALDVLPTLGLLQYEISNFARPGCECRHNLRYWRNEPYLGIGPGAAGYVDGVRYRNVADIRSYVEKVSRGDSPWAEHEQLPPDGRARETAMLELRLTSGIDRKRFAERFGADPAYLFADAIERHAQAGLLEVDERAVRLTRAGLLVANRVMADFLCDRV